MKRITVIMLVLLVAMASVFAGGSNEAPAATVTTNTKTAAAEKPATYTWNGATSTFPTNWNPHIYETATDNDLLDYMQCGFYTFDYNEDETGYAVVPLMATEEPIDVTDQYIGKFGLTEDAKNQAYIIKIRNDIKWNDGTPINAYDFVESQKRLLNPVAQNYRADNLYSGNMVIVNAKNYLYQGQSVMAENATNAYYAKEDLTVGEGGQYFSQSGEPVYLAVKYPLQEWLGGNTLAAYVGAYGDAYFDTKTWADLEALADDLADYFARYFMCPIPYLIYKGFSEPDEIISFCNVSIAVANNVCSNLYNRRNKYGSEIFDYERPLIEYLNKENQVLIEKVKNE